MRRSISGAQGAVRGPAMIEAIKRARKGKTDKAVPMLELSRVLVVEDDPVLAMATEDILRNAGVQDVEVCPTTEAAMEALRTQRPDAVVLDVHLSDRDDGWAIAELLEAFGNQSPRIVFATGSPEAIPAAVAELGIVLTKPYLPADLIDALRKSSGRGFFAKLRDAAR